MKGISTLLEVVNRGKILDISRSVIRYNVFIVIFADGSQANIDLDTKKQLTI